MNTKKTTLGLLLLSTVALGVMETHVLAEEVAQKETNAQVKFKAAEGTVTPPVDPTDPETPVEPVDPTDPTKPVEPGTAGPLSIDFVSILDFGDNEISTQDKVYNATAQALRFKDKEGKESEKHVPLYAQVTDNRGTLEGWTLSVKQNGQLKSNENQAELQGAEISFKDTVLSSISQSKAPSIVTTSFTLNPEGEIQKVTEANEKEGAGSWATTFGEENNIKDEDGRKVTESVQLAVPGKSEKLNDTYATTLTWMLTNQPANMEK